MSPCWTIVESSVDLGTCDRATLIEALKDMGWNPTINGDMLSFMTEYGAVQIRDGAVVMRGAAADNAETVKAAVKQAVMSKAIEKAGKKFGWSVTVDKQHNKVKLKRG